MTYRELFDVAIGDTPPSAIDLERVIRRQRWLVRARRIGAAGVAAAAALAVMLGVGLMVDRQHRKALPAAAARATRPPYRISNDQRPSAYSARYRNEVAAAFAARAPGVRWLRPEAVRVLRFPTGPTSDTPTGRDTEDYRNVGFSVGLYPVDPAGAFSNELSVMGTAEPQPGMVRYVMECGRQQEDSCGVSSGPGGAQVRESASVENPGAPSGTGLHVRRVVVHYPDGTYVQVFLLSGDGRFLLSPAQLRDLALDPALRPTW